MKIQNPILMKSIGLSAAMFFRTLMSTLDFKAGFYDPAADPAIWSDKRKYIFLFWHEHILLPLFLRRHSNVTMMLSPHGDAEIVSIIANHLGMNCIRGSSYRGGVIALKQFINLSGQRIMAFAGDGPRGPRRQLAPGAVFLASKLQLPIVLGGFGYSKNWRFNSWDKFALPFPFARGRMIMSNMLEVPPKLSKNGIEHYRREFENALAMLTDEAEDWAHSSEPLLGESVACCGPKCSLMYYGNDNYGKIRED